MGVTSSTLRLIVLDALIGCRAGVTIGIVLHTWEDRFADLLTLEERCSVSGIILHLTPQSHESMHERFQAQYHAGEVAFHRCQTQTTAHELVTLAFAHRYAQTLTHFTTPLVSGNPASLYVLNSAITVPA